MSTQNKNAESLFHLPKEREINANDYDLTLRGLGGIAMSETNTHVPEHLGQLPAGDAEETVSVPDRDFVGDTETVKK